MGVIHTGVGQWQLSWTDELLFDTEAARARAAVLGPPSSLALRQLVAGDVSQLSKLACDTPLSRMSCSNALSEGLRRSAGRAAGAGVAELRKVMV